MNTTTKTGETMKISIDGMSCGHCVNAVTKALAAVPGVNIRSVAIGSAEIEATEGWDGGKAIAALQQAGYTARVTAGEPLTALKTSGGCCGGANATNKLNVGNPTAAKTGGCCG